MDGEEGERLVWRRKVLWWWVALRERPGKLPATSAMLRALRLGYWRQRIMGLTLPKRETREILGAISNALSAAA